MCDENSTLDRLSEWFEDLLDSLAPIFPEKSSIPRLVALVRVLRFLRWLTLWLCPW
jgi:hypothetical protein